jgi:ABC-type Zn uptake system ZnuABC Zn-binding protein ZnuA
MCLPRFLSALLALLAAGQMTAQPSGRLRVCATTSDLADLARTVGGDDVSVHALCSGVEDPHFLDAKPGYLRRLAEADLLVRNGLGLEEGWLPALVQNARNARILAGAPGDLDASRTIRALQAPGAGADRSAGDVHGGGNPHYLPDPLCGLEVAARIKDALAALRPGRRQAFDERLAGFRRRLGEAMVGAELHALYDFEKLALLFEHGTLREFLARQGDDQKLGGWLGALLPHRGARVVADHDLWPYFARRFGLEISGLLEPKPGIAPTTRHLAALVETMRKDRVALVLAAPYFDPRHARFVAQATGARVVELAHQTGARPDAGDYLATVARNVHAVLAELEETR